MTIARSALKKENQRSANPRVIAESCLAAMIGIVWIIQTSWLDLDAAVSPYWFLVLLAIGFAFGCFGRSPVLLVGPATSIATMYLVVVILGYGGFKMFFKGLLLGVVLFVIMSAVVFIGAAVGRGVKRCWIKKKARYVS